MHNCVFMPGIIMFDACSSMSLHAPEPYKHDLLIITKLTPLIHFGKGFMC